jgi:Zn-dependent protease with chaperone function
MRFVALGTVLALVWFLVLDVMLTAVVAALARAYRDAWLERPVARARLLLMLRLLPGVLAASFVLFAFVPIFWRLEPHDTVETVSSLLLMGSLAAALLVVVAMRRGWCAARHARQVSRRFLQSSTPLKVDADFPTALVADTASTISLVGAVRPRLFVARRVIETLTPAELRAAIAHEQGHHRSRDNLKRLAMAWWPDALALTATGAWLEREWARAAEIAADATAVGTDAARALDLASALVKVARLASVPSSASVLHSTLHDGGDIATRVRRLAALADARSVLPVTRLTSLTGATVAAAAAVVLAIFCGPQVPSIVQRLTELIVRFAA